MSQAKKPRYQYSLISPRVKTEDYRAVLDHLTKMGTDVSMLFRDTSKYLATGVVIMSVNSPLNLYSDVETLKTTINRISMLLGNFEMSSYFKIIVDDRTTTYKLNDEYEWYESKIEFADGRVVYEEVKPNKHGLTEFFKMDLTSAEPITSSKLFQFKEKYADIVMFGILEESTTHTDDNTTLSINYFSELPSQIPEPETVESTVTLLARHYNAGFMLGSEMILLHDKWIYKWSFNGTNITLNKTKGLPDSAYEPWELENM
jgi:hypothetical protein